MDPTKYPHIRDYDDEDHRKQVQAWSILKEQANNEPGESIRFAILAGGAVRGLPPHQAKRIAKQWENKGIVVTLQNGGHVALTTEGTEVDDPTKVE